MATPDIQHYGTVPSRNLIRTEVQMLKEVETVEVLGQFGATKPQPLNKTDTVVFRRVDPWNMQANGAPGIGDPSTFILAEGINPPSNSITYTDVSATVQNYGILFKLSSKTALMYEDDVPSDMRRVTSKTLAEVTELIRWGVIRGGTVVDYAAPSASRAQVNGVITLDMLRRIARTLENARASEVTSMMKSGPLYDVSAIEPAYLVFAHTDLEADIRNLPGFVPVVKYGTGAKIHSREIGAVERFRFILSPIFAPFLGAGNSTVPTGIKSVGGTNVDVYPFIVMAEDAFAHVPLKGHGAISPVYLPPSQRDKMDPLGMFGVVGANFWTTSVRLNENYMVRGEVGVSSLA